MAARWARQQYVPMRGLPGTDDQHLGRSTGGVSRRAGAGSPRRAGPASRSCMGFLYVYGSNHRREAIQGSACSVRKDRDLSYFAAAGAYSSSRRALTYSEPENVADISQGRGSSHRVFSSTTNIRIPESHRENGRITQSSAFISVGKPRAGKMLYALYPPLSG